LEVFHGVAIQKNRGGAAAEKLPGWCCKSNPLILYAESKTAALLSSSYSAAVVLCLGNQPFRQISFFTGFPIFPRMNREEHRSSTREAFSWWDWMRAGSPALIWSFMVEAMQERLCLTAQPLLLLMNFDF